MSSHPATSLLSNPEEFLRMSILISFFFEGL
jgi:hypothetical protein